MIVELEMQNIIPGDIIKHNNTVEYVFECDDGTIGINACNEHWIELGRRDYGDELYNLNQIDLEGFEIVGHYGAGYLEEGRKWYDLGKPY